MCGQNDFDIILQNYFKRVFQRSSIVTASIYAFKVKSIVQAKP